MLHRPIANFAATCVTVVAVTSVANASTITLSAGQSIQTAIASAQNGDRIELLPGTYVGTIDYLGKAITISGVNGPDATILDGTGFNKAVVTFKSGETQSSVLERVTVRGGHGATKAGGGIRCENLSNPRVRDCRIVSNTAATLAGFNPDQGGAGIAIVNASALIDHCFIGANSGPVGAGLHQVGSFVTVRNCVFDANQGIGIYAELGGDLTLTGTRVEDHSDAGAIVKGTNLFGAECVFARNSNRGLYYDQQYGDAVLRRMTFLDNSTSDSAGGGGLLFFTGPSPSGAPQVTIESCLFAGNSAPIGSAASLSSDDEGLGELTPESIRIESCTFADNGPGSVVASRTPGVWFHNSIVRGTAPLFAKLPGAPSSTLAVASYSNIQGGFPGTGNMDVDPLFAEPLADDFHLRTGSPCVGVGDPLGPTPALDLDGNTRGAAGSNEMGCDEQRPHLEVAGDLGVGGLARVALYDIPQSTPAVLLLSPVLGPGIGAFGLGSPLLPIVFPAIPASGFLAATAIVPSGIQPITVYAQAWTGSAFTAIERIDLW